MFTSNSLFPKHSFTILSDLELLSKVKKILITRSSQSVIVNNRVDQDELHQPAVRLSLPFTRCCC